ncbi:MAG: hypothetical protein EXR11_11325 [Rhodospirillaceae bacterium]|nr:hypothetical protein [Rhodospirillaceae bacterium]
MPALSRRRCVLLPLFVASVLAGSAAAQDGARDKGQEINACSYLSASDVTAALGHAVEAGERNDSRRTGGGAYPDNGSYSSTCLWKVSADRDKADPKLPMGGASFVIFNAMSWPAGSGLAKTFPQSFRDAAKDHTIAMMPVAVNIGDEALWWGDGVAVAKGDISFGISVHLIGERAKERGIEEALAAKIVTRLP